jgi:hypothetical protein
MKRFLATFNTTAARLSALYLILFSVLRGLPGLLHDRIGGALPRQ